jgi:hypothetical protein
MPWDYREYHPKWSLIVRLIRKRTMDQHDGVDCCQGSPHYPDCRALNGHPHPVTGSPVVLTTAHIDNDKDNNDFKNLARWCQRCHLRHDLGHHIMNRRYGRKHSGKHQLKIFRVFKASIYKPCLLVPIPLYTPKPRPTAAELALRKQSHLHLQLNFFQLTNGKQ